MLITTLVENSVNKSGLMAEHGLSFFLETGDESILFDTGQCHALIHNVANMGIDLSEVNKIVLSHGHSDHTGGLGDALKAMGGAHIYAHPDIFDEKYSNRECERRPIGITYTRESLELMGAELHLSKEPMQIADGIRTTGEIERQNDFEYPHSRLCVMRDGVMMKDGLKDDLSLIVDGKDGIAVIFGCGHSGVINTLNQVKRMTNGKPIRLVVGGIHLIDADKNRIDRVIREIMSFDIEKFALCHCTGELAMIQFYQTFGDRMIFNHVGTQIEWN